MHLPLSRCCCGCDRQRCAEGCDRFCPCVTIYPTLCTSFLLLIAAAVFTVAFGAYAFISLRLSIFKFDWSQPWLVIVNSSLLALIVTALLLLISFSLWCICSTSTRGLLYKAFVLFFLFLAILVLATVMVASILIIHGANDGASAFSGELASVWVKAVRDPNSTVACRTQKQLSCRGLEPGDCELDSKTANYSLCATVCRPEDVEDGKAEFGPIIYPGCRSQIASFFVLWNAVLLAGEAVAFILALVAFLMTCIFVSFQDDK